MWVGPKLKGSKLASLVLALVCCAWGRLVALLPWLQEVRMRASRNHLEYMCYQARLALRSPLYMVPYMKDAVWFRG